MTMCRRACLAVAGICLLGAVAAPTPARTEQLSFGYYRSSAFQFSTEDATKLVKGLNDLLITDAGVGDRPCLGFTYELKGTPARYSSSLPNVVADDEEARAFASSPFTIHIVSSIETCGGRLRAEGCAFVGGPILIAKRYAKSLPQLFLHEIGHAQTLDHHNSTSNFMFETVSARSVRSENWQCDALKSKAFVVQVQAQVQLPLEDFVSGIWVHGVPTERIQALTVEEIDQVRKWVAEDRQDAYAYWPNAVTILGLRGNKGDVALMRRVLNSTSDDQMVANAKINVPGALGYLAYRTRDGEAYSLLAGMLSPNFNQRFLSTVRASEADELSVAMAREATKGIAVVAGSGNDNARMLLAEQALKQETGSVDLGVSSSFFKMTDKLRQSVETKGLVRSLKEKLQ